ncbi:MAG: DNA polymerase I, partial [Aerococcus sanguinicola]
VTKKNKLLLFDGSSLAFRAFYAIQNLDSFVNKNGLHTNALYAFHAMLKTVLDKEEPTHALVAWDAGKTTFRTEMYDDYKGGRQSAPDEFREQMPFFNVLLDAFGLAHYELANYEADDIIGTLALQADPETFDVVVISGDRDLTQLARDNIRVDITRRGVSQLEEYTPASIQENWQITPEQIVDMKGLMGDSSDNYPGVTGIGEKTALKLLHEFGSMEGVYDNIDKVSGKKRKENLIKDKEAAFLSKKLARILDDAPLEIGYDDIKKRDLDQEALLDFYKEMNFNRFMTDLLEDSDLSDQVQAEARDIPYQVLTEADQVTAEIFQAEEMAFYGEMFAKNYHQGEIIAFALGNSDQVYVLPKEVALASSAFREWAEDASRTKQVFDAKRTKVMLAREGIDFQGVSEDVLIASYLVHAKDNSNDLAEAAREFGIDDLAYDEMVYGKGKKQAVPEDESQMHDHLARKIDVICRMVPIAKERLAADQMTELYRDMELPLALVLANMEIRGIRVERSTLEAMHEAIEGQLDDLEAAIYQEAGHEFNINSTQQLSDVLFEEMGLPAGKKTKSGHYSTAQSELEKLQGKAEIVDLILDYRQLAKLQSTYIEGIQNFIQEDHKVHTRFIQTLTTTGRLSSADPNLQNIPIRTENGRKIRQAFVPSEPGWKIFSSDYSQIELRVLAHISGDEHLQKAFKENRDIHRTTASRVLGIDEVDVTPNQRRDAKAVNFGIVYGISDYGLSKNLNISRPQAKAFIDSYFDNFPKVKVYMDEIVESAREKGYVETLFHRRRYLPDIKARNFNVRSFAERTAMNTPIQGTAADIIKLAMLKMEAALEEEGLQAKLLIQVHDELIFEAPEEEIARLEELVPQVMESAVELDVPLIVDSNYGDTWYDAK